MKCMLCDSDKYKFREGKVRDNQDLKIVECDNCGLVYLDSFDHINNDFYEESGIHDKVDFFKWQRTTAIDDERRFNFLKKELSNKTLMDFGSGNGGFVNLAKNIAHYVCAVELEKAVIPYYHDREIDLYKSIKDTKREFDIITSFHVLEHLKNPHEILIDMKKHLKENGKIIIEVPNANDALLTIYKNLPFSEFTYWSCHLFLYTEHTLKILAKQCGLNVDFIKYIQRYPLSNHLYWLSNGKPGGDKEWGSFIDSTELTNAYEAQLSSIGATDTIICQFSIIK
ncbi:methyltransferase [Arcobacter sp. CECT 8983]|uniref:class I SAM-dependent methyltransferase n=1 Tax=Arcobacter sp. CECT 8983 TaxID=2044508 RepID=UPI00100A8ABD|nr:class I SAM-dependent methyltransferase [Arcobacter sp. CECT 8983]RXJ89461.1 methyltransferase [Arcobacter sp. CECT 8983]